MLLCSDEVVVPIPTLVEAQDSRDDLTYGVNGGGITIRYHSYGSDFESDHFDGALLVSPETYLGFIRQTITPKRIGPLIYKTDVHYGTVGQGGSEQPTGTTPTPPTQPGGGGGGSENVPLGPDYNLEVTGGTVHITKSFETRYRRAFGDDDTETGSAPDYQGAIGVSKDHVEGVDVLDTGVEWSRTVIRENVTNAYVDGLAALRGKVNNAIYYNGEIGEQLYIGTSGKATENGKWSLTHKFIKRKNQTDLIIVAGDPEDGAYPYDALSLTLPVVRGHEHVWVKYAENTVGDEVAPRPLYAYVEVIHQLGNFDAIGMT